MPCSGCSALRGVKMKEIIIAKDNQWSGIERDRLTEHGKIIEQIERQSLKLKTDVWERKYIEIIRRYYHIAWSAEKI